MNIRRTLVIGLGSASAVALTALRAQFAMRYQGNIPVIKTVLIDCESDQHPFTEGVELISLAAGENPANSTQIIDTIDRLTNDLLEGDHISRLQKVDIHVEVDVPVELIIVGDLSDEMVYSSVLELTKTIYLHIEQKQTMTKPKAASLILALPMLHRSSAVANETRQRIRQCIRSINVYLQQANNIYNIDATQQTINHVYLLEQINNKQMRLPSIDALLWMAGNWLYFYLTDSSRTDESSTSAESIADSKAPVRFRSLGYASLFVPIKHMAVILSDWFITSVFANHLLAAPHLPKEELQDGRTPTSDDTQRYFQSLAEKRWQKESLTAEAITSEMRIPNSANRCRINEMQFGNSSYHLYQTLEQRLGGEYNRILKEELPKLHEQQIEKQHELIRQIQSKLINTRTYYLDEYEDGIQAPVRTAIRMFTLLTEEFNRRGEEQRKRIITEEKTIADTGRFIINKRASFWDAAQTFGSPPFFFPIVSGLVTLISIAYLAWIVWVYLNQPIPALVVIASTLLLLVAGILVTMQRIENQKADFIKLYAQRLNNIMKQHEARVLRNVYTQLTTMANLFQDELLYFKNLLKAQVDERVNEKRSAYEPLTLEELEASLSREQKQQLYDAPRYTLEQSLIEQDDLQRWYMEIFTNLQRDLHDFFSLPSSQPLSAWFKAMVESHQPPRQTLRAALENWVMDEKTGRLDRLRKEPIGRYLARYPIEQQKQFIEHICNMSHVYSRLNPLVNTAQDTQEQSRIWIADKDKRFIEQIFKEIGGNPPTMVNTSEPWQVVSLSVLKQQPLDAFLMLQDLDVSEPGSSVAEPLDPITQTRLSISAIVALASSTGVLHIEQGELGYQDIDKEKKLLYGIDQARVFIALGTTYSVIVSRLQKPTESEHLRVIRQQVMQQLQDLTTDDPSGRTLILALRNYVNTSSADSHEKSQLENYIKLLVDHFTDRQTSV